MLSQIQRFGGAMFTPVLLFPFAGIVVGLAILLQNPMFVGESLTDPNSLFAQIVHIIEEGGWTVFRNMPLIFAVGLPIGLAKQAQGRACLAVMVSFLTWNYFINAISGALIARITGTPRQINRLILDCSLANENDGNCFAGRRFAEYGDYYFGRAEGQPARGPNLLRSPRGSNGSSKSTCWT